MLSVKAHKMTISDRKLGDRIDRKYLPNSLTTILSLLYRILLDNFYTGWFRERHPHALQALEELHLVVENTNNQNPMLCHLCSTMVSYEKDMKRHRENHHKLVDGMVWEHNCLQCGSEFRSSEELVGHQENHCSPPETTASTGGDSNPAVNVISDDEDMPLSKMSKGPRDKQQAAEKVASLKRKSSTDPDTELPSKMPKRKPVVQLSRLDASLVSKVGTLSGNLEQSDHRSKPGGSTVQGKEVDKSSADLDSQCISTNKKRPQSPGRAAEPSKVPNQAVPSAVGEDGPPLESQPSGSDGQRSDISDPLPTIGTKHAAESTQDDLESVSSGLLPEDVGMNVHTELEAIIEKVVDQELAAAPSDCGSPGMNNVTENDNQDSAPPSNPLESGVLGASAGIFYL